MPSSALTRAYCLADPDLEWVNGICSEEAWDWNSKGYCRARLRGTGRAVEEGKEGIQDWDGRGDGVWRLRDIGRAVGTQDCRAEGIAGQGEGPLAGELWARPGLCEGTCPAPMHASLACPN